MHVRHTLRAFLCNVYTCVYLCFIFLCMVMCMLLYVMLDAL